jgi:hypothetical protein
MLATYPKSKPRSRYPELHEQPKPGTYFRGTAWHHLLEHMPEHEDDGYRFRPMQHNLRKSHTGNEWRWYVERWRYQGSEVFDEPPCEAPPDLEIDGRSYPYVWATWTERDGAPSCGFFLVGGANLG